MRLLLPILFLIGCLPDAGACGYSFVGGCSTDLNLTINGTEATFAVAQCAYETGLDGLQLGTLRSLHLSRARAITWESCFNNVSAVQLRYRVYEEGQSVPGFQNLDLPEDYNTLEGPYTTRYRELTTDLDLCNALTINKKYVLEVYFLAEVDTLGDDFIPETTLVQNNNGNNYRLTFTYGGPAAPPLLAVVTTDEDLLCHGDSTGVAGVKVFGSAAGDLFYTWSAFTQNFFTLFELPAGSYTVTVTEASSGNTATATIQITEPAALTAGFVDVSPIGCSGAPGGATAVVSGGQEPYLLAWSSGQSTTQLTTATSGPWILSVTDASGCTTTGVVEIGAAAAVTLSANRAICAGEALSVGGLTLTESGTYQVSLPGNGAACDTLLNLSLVVLEPALALPELPTSVVLTCAQPTLELCVDPLPNTTVVWQQNGLSVATSNCYTATQAGLLAVTVTQQSDNLTCSATRQIQTSVQASVPAIQEVAQHTLCNGLVAAVCVANGGQAPYTFTWSDPTLEGSPVSALPGLYWVTVTDAGGCFSSSALLIADFGVTTTVSDASALTASDGAISVAVTGAATAPFLVEWSNGALGPNLTDLAPGQYCFTVTEAGGCTRSECLEVTSPSGSSLISAQPFGAETGLLIWPNPVKVGGLVFTPTIPSKATWEMFSTTGQLIDKQSIAPFSEQIRVPEKLPEGWYRVVLRNDNFTRTGKIFLTTGR